MTARPYCDSEHTTRDGKRPAPRHAEYRCTVCGKRWCAGCLLPEYTGYSDGIGRHFVRWVCGDGECGGEVGAA